MQIFEFGSNSTPIYKRRLVDTPLLLVPALALTRLQS